MAQLGVARFAAVPPAFPKLRQSIRRQGVCTWKCLLCRWLRSVQTLWLPPNVHPDDDLLSEHTATQLCLSRGRTDVISSIGTDGSLSPKRAALGICPSWVSTRLKQGKGFGSALIAARTCPDVIATTSLPILNLQAQGVCHSTSDMASSCLAPFSWGIRRPFHSPNAAQT